MPAETKITCDVCGEQAQAYPSFFQLRDVNAGRVLSAGAGNIVKSMAPERVVDTAGCLRWGHTLYLCGGHFKSLTAACEAWFTDRSTETE